MRLWIDTEFNGYQGSLISIALVDEEGRVFYEACHFWQPVDPWVQANVIPVLNTTPIPKPEMQIKLEKFLQPYTTIHLIADWPEDLAYFCNLLITGPGKRIDTPRLTMEIRRDLDGAVSKIPHNALADAVSIREEHLRLTA